MKRRIVLKFGTNVLRNDEGEIAIERINSFIEQMAKLIEENNEVIVVTSGAVGLGAKKLGINTKGSQKNSLFDKQAAASVGQSLLMKIYEDGFDKFNITVAQILLTEEDFSNRHKYLSLRNTLNRLLELNVVPIINQNDAVSPSELEHVAFSDNDKLSALVASKLDADLLVMVSDVDGLFDKNPKEFEDAKLISTVDKITPKIEALATGASAGGRGGMITKLLGAKVVTNSGGKAVIINGKVEGIISKYFEAAAANADTNNKVGTEFLPNKTLSSKHRWIAYATNIPGILKVNAGAKKALVENKTSLLPIGVTGIEGEFGQGDVIAIVDEDNNEFARGIANYSSVDFEKIIGVHSDKIQEILGFKISDDIISKDNLVIL